MPMRQFKINFIGYVVFCICKVSNYFGRFNDLWKNFKDLTQIKKIEIDQIILAISI